MGKTIGAPGNERARAWLVRQGMNNVERVREHL